VRCFGWIIFAIGTPFLISGVALHHQIEGFISTFKLDFITGENVSSNIDWIRGIYWPAPYLLWVGITLTVLACAIGLIGLLDAK